MKKIQTEIDALEEAKIAPLRSKAAAADNQ